MQTFDKQQPITDSGNQLFAADSKSAINIMPLHPAQSDILRAQMLHPYSAFYNIGGYIKLKGPLSKQKFLEAVNEAPGVFDVFRMRLLLQEAEAVCLFDATNETTMVTEMDLTDHSDPQETAMCWMKERFNAAFDISGKQALFENVLIKIAADEYWFFMRYHHLMMDGFSFKIWLEYLASKYTLFTTGQCAGLVYPSYETEIIKALDYRNSVYSESVRNYWEERITTKPEKILLRKHYDDQRQKALTFTYTITEAQQKIIDALQVTTQVSLQQLTIAALLIFFGKTTSASDFVFGIPLHNRTSKQMRNVVGMFSSMLPFKEKFEPSVKVYDFLKALSALQKKDYRYKNFQFGDICKRLQINTNEENLYEIVVNYEQLNLALLFGDAIEAKAEQLISEQELTPLQICWQDFGKRQPLALQLVFREDYFSTDEIVLLTKRLLFIIEQFTGSLEREVGNIEIIPEEEAQLIQSFNSTTTYTPDKSLAALFEMQAAKTPDGIALLFEEQQLTYQQLNEQSNQLARHLAKKGVTKNTPVSICMERSIQMMIAVIGISKSGGTYVPIDPTYPLERKRYILEDTATRIIITSSFGKTVLPTSEEADYIFLDKDWASIAKEPDYNLQRPICPASLAYILYTSGSTGKPKGVQMPVQNLVNLLMWQDDQIRHAHRYVLQYASLNFDVSFQEIFSTLCFGGSLCLINERQRKDMSALSAVINRYGVTHLFLPFVVLKNFADHVITESVNHSSLQTIIVAGEQLHLTKEIKHLLNSSLLNLINQYGPTEAHVVTSYTIDQSYDYAVTLPPIGKPISNCRIYILDSRLQLLPVGSAGEICIAGAGVAAGYRNNEKLTAEKFIDNPFSEGKMYRTGDIGKWLPDGNLLYLGRADDQVKINGHRIETGDIESILNQCFLVSQCVVVAKASREGIMQLVCYIVSTHHFDQNAIEAYLEMRVPRHMVPSVFIPLKALPVSTNGKIDKDALPAPDTFIKEGYVLPKTAMEKALAEIWQEVLGVEKVGVKDNFFELGGHSILVVKAIGKMSRYLGKNMPPTTLYQHATVEKYAAFLLTEQPAPDNKHIVPIKHGLGKMPLYIICHIGIAPLSRFIPFAGFLHDAQPVFGIQWKQVSELSADSIRIEDIAESFVTELLHHNPKGPYAFAGYSIGGLIAIEMAKHLEKKGKEVAIICLFDTIAHTIKMSESGTLKNSLHKIKYQLYDWLRKTAHKLYYKIDNNLYLLKYDTVNTIKGKKKLWKGRLKKLVSRDMPAEPKKEWHVLREVAMAAYLKYKLTPYNGNINLFRAKRRTVYLADNKFLGWKPYVKSVKVHNTEGNHYTMFNTAHSKELAKQVQQCLDECADKL